MTGTDVQKKEAVHFFRSGTHRNPGDNPKSIIYKPSILL